MNLRNALACAIGAVGISLLAPFSVAADDNNSFDRDATLQASGKVVQTLLPTVDDAGEWPCVYYMLNYNSDLNDAEKAKWYRPDEDESDWIKGVGPFSNDENKFFITEWPSQVRPILVRRHFNITADQAASLSGAIVTLLCSYDEDPVIYLNGVRIWSATGWNDNDFARFNLTRNQKILLTEGDNLLAVSLRQGGGGGHIDYGLIMETSNTDSPGGLAEVGIDSMTQNYIYNLQGQRMDIPLELLPGGIYICNGEKIIIP